MRQSVDEKINKVLKDLGEIKNSLWYYARKYGCDSIGLDYENAVGYIEFAIRDLKDAKLNAKMAERKRKKMRKAITRKKAYKAMNKMIRYCSQQKCCSEKCIFFYKGMLKHCCVSFLQSPSSWDKETVRKRMEAGKCK